MASLAKNEGKGTPNAPYDALAEEDALSALTVSSVSQGTFAWRASMKSGIDGCYEGAHLGAVPRCYLYEGGALDVVVDPLKAVAQIVAKHTTITSLTAATPLQTLGLDSLDAMACVRELNAVTGAALSVVDVLSAKTLGEVASLVPTSVDSDLFDRRPGRVAEALFYRGRTETKLASLGLDSLDAMAVVKDLSDATGRGLVRVRCFRSGDAWEILR